MRRKSNFAPSDSEKREDERCMGLHSNDMVEIVGVCMQGCVCVCVLVSVCMSAILYSLPGTLKLPFLNRGKCSLQNCFIPLQTHIIHDSAQWVVSAKLLDGHVESC